MSTRGTLDDLFSVLRSAPWWAGPVLSLGVYLLLGFVLPGLFESTGFNDSHDTPALGPSLAVLIRLIAPYAALAIVMVWVATLLARVLDRNRLDAQEGIDSIRKLSWSEFGARNPLARYSLEDT